MSKASSIDHAWHVWINRRQDERREAGEGWEGHLYNFKSMLQSFGYFQAYIKRAREGTLPTTHRQCSHSAPEPIKENKVVCALGVDVSQCPILASLQAVFDEERGRKFPDGRPVSASTIEQDDVYEVMAKTCAWHLFMSSVAHGQLRTLPSTRRGKEVPGEPSGMPRPAYIDWNEGAMQDTSDRMFWDRVYTNLAGGPPVEPEGDDTY